MKLLWTELWKLPDYSIYENDDGEYSMVAHFMVTIEKRRDSGRVEFSRACFSTNFLVFFLGFFKRIRKLM